MVRDNAPKEHQKKQLERKQGRRASYDRILIFSEGSKTEPNYFREIRAAYRLHKANVEVRPSELGTAPTQVVQYANKLFEGGDRHRSIQARAFEQVFAVFDRDDHDSYHDALAQADQINGQLRNDIRKPVTFRAIAFVPSFELWLLLHFEDKNTMAQNDTAKNGNGGNLGFEADLFKAADKLRGNMGPSDYKHVALWLIFLKYISDAFEAKHKALLTEDTQAVEDKDEHLSGNVFWVQKEARP
ncbi:MAG: RloB domain-containing protein [Candidatus Protistobacter heckmanni]|nr:RloB domain-containing protein [Candidatus Protistobacter heckmanni]